MAVSVQEMGLVQYLKRKDPVYFGKFLELREVLTGWLGYIPQTFPHYTRHTVEHSDAIVLQLSKLLFEEDNIDRCVINLSAVEAFILVAAALLHDAGMVISDAAKSGLLHDESWREWTQGEGDAAPRFLKIKEFRDGEFPPDSTVRNFLADIQLRHLIAEHVRRNHHERAADVIRLNQTALARFAFDDPELLKAISDVCVGHGLARALLDDKNRYPTTRQLKGEDANIRLLAILLRLGDLLDLQSSRACPLLLNAASPLPSESLVHWDQYAHITHRAVSPHSIELRAECLSPNEHRVLRDWCQWIVDEVREAPQLLAGSKRHSTWKPPHAAMFSESATICITPAAGANYRPVDWKFQLNENEVLGLLISDVYQDRTIFVRELVQNGLDATRCRMYEDLYALNEELPSVPTEIPNEIRRRYPLKIQLESETVLNELTGQNESRQVVVVDDCGIGMDEATIRSHLLQIGRSYYTTAEFKSRYKFTPSSRFGIGFLSVFGASDHILLETLRFGSDDTKSLKLTLVGPRNYIIVEQGERHTPGTRVRVRLVQGVRIRPGQLKLLVREWCRKVEVPVEVSEPEGTEIVEAERPGAFDFEITDLTTKNCLLTLRHYEIQADGVRGELYVFVRKLANGSEDWTSRRWYQYRYPELRPDATIISIPPNLTCLQGIRVSEQHGLDSQIARIDIRGGPIKMTLSRDRMFRGDDAALSAIVAGVIRQWERLVESHLEQSLLPRGSYGWKYANRVADEFPLTDDFWRARKGMIPAYNAGKLVLYSMEEFESLPLITEVVNCLGQTSLEDPVLLRAEEEHKLAEADLSKVALAIKEVDASALCNIFGRRILAKRAPLECRWLDKTFFAIDWQLQTVGSTSVQPVQWVDQFPCALPNPETIGVFIARHGSFRTSSFLINTRNPFGRWYFAILSHWESGSIEREKIKILSGLVVETARYAFREKESDELTRHVSIWRAMPGLPGELQPPDLRIRREMFIWRSDRP